MLKAILSTEERVSRSRTRILRKAPFFGVLALKLNIVHDDSCNTMAVDGVSLFYAKPFVDRIPDEELDGVIVHEVLHCACRHFSRRGNRDAKDWNIAADYAINPMVLAAGFKLPADHLFDRDYVGLNVEEIYQLEARKRKAGKPAPKPCDWGQVRDTPRADANGTPIEKGETDKQWEHSTKQATMVAKRQAKAQGKKPGNIAAGVTELVAVLERGRVDWRSEVRQFIDQSSTKDASWTRPNRRLLWQGIILPGQASNRPNRVVCLVDISGSMDADAVKDCLSEVQSMLDDGAADYVDVVYVDTAVHRVDCYEAGDRITFWEGIGGGTDFRSAMALIATMDASCVIGLTDGGVAYPRGLGVNPRVPVLWCITGPQQQADWVDAQDGFYGRAIPMYG